MADEKTIRSVSRRRTLFALLGGVAVAGGARAQRLPPRPPACIISPPQTEGPYFLDQRLRRSDIRADTVQGTVSAGVPLALQIRVLAADAGCGPMSGVMVEVWHCNAEGAYSGVHDPRFGKTGADFLRGYQTTDDEGAVRFATIYPGWYPGRAVHIHVKLRWPAGGQQRMGREWTSQLYFDDEVTDRVHARMPYSSSYASSARQRQRNMDDALFRRGGKDLLVSIANAGEGYVARFDLGVRSN